MPPEGAAAPPWLDYETLSHEVVNVLKARHSWHRVLSVDLETKILQKGDFLTGERLLAIGTAMRTPASNQVKIRNFLLKDDSDESEAALLLEFARYVAETRPLVLLGYNISGYDFPLLILKQKWLEGYFRQKSAPAEKTKYPQEYWALKDALTRTYVLDLMHPLRFAMAQHDNTTPKYRSLAYSVAHQKFAVLPLMRRKGLAEADTQTDKGKKIYEMWQARDPAFGQYLEGDVHDVLLLAEELYGVKE